MKPTTKLKSEFLIRKLIREELSGTGFYRANKKSVGKELYAAMRNIKSLYDRLSSGNDLDPGDIDVIIKLLQSVKDSSRQFSNADSIDDDDYR